MDYPRYDPQSPLTPLQPAELDALDRLLQGLPADGVMSLDGVDGYLTALAAGPADLLATLPTAEWLPLVWGGDGPEANEGAEPFASKRQRKTTVVQLLRHLRFVAEALQEPESWEPIFSIAEQGATEWADASDWCTGFLQAVDLLPSAWDGAWADPAVAPLLQLGGGLDGVDTPAVDAEGEALDLDDPACVDRLSRAVPEAVLRLRAAFTRTGAAAPPPR
jgi:uncharacterized protein